MITTNELRNMLICDDDIYFVKDKTNYTVTEYLIKLKSMPFRYFEIDKEYNALIIKEKHDTNK